MRWFCVLLVLVRVRDKLMVVCCEAGGMVVDLRDWAVAVVVFGSVFIVVLIGRVDEWVHFFAYSVDVEVGDVEEFEFIH
mgnify:CR=1 FL=1